MKRRVLFLCATNGLHSPMAEALLRHIDPLNFEAVSAGISCGQVHPFSIQVMNEIGVDLTHKKTRCVEELSDEPFDFVITLDEATATLRYPVNAPELVHWRFENPLAVSTDPELQLRAFRSVRDQIAQRLRLFTIVHVRPAPSSVRVQFEYGKPVTQVR